MNKKFQVFVSSTYEDLQEERKKVMEALLQMNCFPVGMEYFNASDESQWDVIKSLIDECDYYVLIIAGRYGSIEESSGKSYTQKEYEYARSIGVPTIAFLHSNVSSLPKSKTESDPSVEHKLDLFKDDVKKHLCKFWENGDQLASQVVLSLTSLVKAKPRVGWVKGDQYASPEANAEIVRLRKEIDDLNKTIHVYEDSAPQGIEDLAQGEDLIQLSFYNYTYGGDDGMSFTWNNLIVLLSPHLYVEASEETLKKALVDCVEKSGVLGDGLWSIHEADFQKVKVQLLALGIIQQSSRTHSSADKSIYWSLTPYGKKVMLTMGAIRRSEKPND